MPITTGMMIPFPTLKISKMIAGVDHRYDESVISLSLGNECVECADGQKRLAGSEAKSLGSRDAYSEASV